MNLAAGGLIPGVSLTRNVELLVNASNQAQNLPGYVPDINNPGTYVLGTYSNFEPGIEIQINGSLSVGSLLKLTGEFDLTLQLAGPNPGLTITAYASLAMALSAA
jgi:hypothetical protein